MKRRHRSKLPLVTLAASLIPYWVLDRAELVIGLCQGKGWGSASYKAEIDALFEIQPTLLQGDLVVIDIGANRGAWSLALLSKRPDTQVTCFEPGVTSFRKLSQTFRNAPNVQLINCAVGNVNCEAALWYPHEGSELASLVKRDLSHFNLNMDNNETVKVIRLDEWCQERNLVPSIIKIDVEGFEMEVLLGSVGVIDQVKVIQFEFGGTQINRRMYFHDFFTFFSDLNFELYRVGPKGLRLIRHYKESDESFTTTNFVAVNVRMKSPQPRN